MLCDNCKKNEATVHLTTIVNNQKKEQHLCSECANTLQKDGKFSPFSSFNTDMWDSNFFTNDFFNNLIYPDNVLRSSHSKTCPGCGITYDMFNRTGKFGCSQCYDTFQDEIGPLIQRLQGSTSDEGRIPGRSSDELKKKRQIKQLREQLNTAIKSEDFERAVTLRDQIKNLEASLGTEGGQA